jgi:hypothetical protein
MTAAPGPVFTMPSSKWLREKQVQGEATIRLKADGLEISGASGGFLRISTAQIGLLKTCWQSVKYGPWFLTRVWLRDEEAPLKLEARGQGFDDYAAVIRGLAAQMARVDGVTRLHRGSSIAAAVELLVPMTLLFLAALAISIFALEHEPWWGRPAPAIVGLLAFLMGAVTAYHRWPRPVRDLEEFNRRVAPSRQRPRLRSRKQ